MTLCSVSAQHLKIGKGKHGRELRTAVERVCACHSQTYTEATGKPITASVPNELHQLTTCAEVLILVANMWFSTQGLVDRGDTLKVCALQRARKMTIQRARSICVRNSLRELQEQAEEDKSANQATEAVDNTVRRAPRHC